MPVVTDDDAKLRQHLADVLGPLIKAEGGPTAASKRVAASTAAISRWSRGLEVTLPGLQLLSTGLRQEITIRITPDDTATLETKEAPPIWAGRLERMIEAIAVASGIPRDSLKEVEALEQYVLELERSQQPLDAKHRKVKPPVQDE